MPIAADARVISNESAVPVRSSTGPSVSTNHERISVRVYSVLDAAEQRLKQLRAIANRLLQALKRFRKIEHRVLPRLVQECRGRSGDLKPLARGGRKPARMVYLYISLNI